MNHLTRPQVLGIALAGLSLRFARAADTDPSRMIVRSPAPTDLEMPLDVHRSHYPYSALLRSLPYECSPRESEDLELEDQGSHESSAHFDYGRPS